MQLREAFVPGSHRATLVKEGVQEFLEPRLRQRGWRDTIVPYAGYGTATWVRVMARVLLRQSERQVGRVRAVRGWRSFATLPAADEVVVIDVGDRQREVRTDRGGYIDVVVEADISGADRPAAEECLDVGVGQAERTAVVRASC